MFLVSILNETQAKGIRHLHKCKCLPAARQVIKVYGLIDV